MNEADLIQKLNEFRNLPAETEVVEFKEAKNDYHFDKIGKYFSALSNEANLKGKQDAWLIFGIENKHRNIVGSNYRHTNRASLDSLKAEIAQKTTNAITFIEIHELKLPEGRIVLFQIPAAPKGLPLAYEGHYYGRNGEELSPLNLEEIERIRRQVAYDDWSAAIVPTASINDLDPSAIAKAKENYKVKNPRIANEITSWDIATFLTKTKILINNKLTRAAIVLLGKPESVVHISPVHPQISWVLYTKDKIEKDYQHFVPPYIMALDEVFAKIRNLKYRYLKDGTLFPEEVDQYDPQNIKEALSNCIAHMDYTLGGKITVAENEDAYISFSNPGSFLPGSVEEVIISEDPPTFYRNTLLVKTMESFNMIDSIGSGIKRMFRVQRQRFFPMPDYDFSASKVKLTLIGKVLDMDYARALVRNPDLDLEEIIMLDKVQKKKTLTDDEVKHLKEKRLIEGRKPNFHISAVVAEKTDQKAEYIKNRGFKDQHYKDLILEFIDKYHVATKENIDGLIIDILPAVLNKEQKENKVRNIVYAMSKKDKTIINKGTIRYPKWQRNTGKI
ncbi:MAG: putative DNA binding domain-containing protein [Verrucomicrobia bacterium]|nr:putative DNA binding domain-containing protein [Verrucomicrobiota bacterium]